MEYLLCCTFLVSSPSIESAGRFITRLTAKQTGLCPTYYSKDLLDRPGPFAHRPDQRFGRLANRSEHHLHFSYQHKPVPPLAPESGFADRAVAAWTSRALSPEGQFGGELLQQRQARILRNRNRDKVYLDAIGYKGSHSYCNVTRQKLCQCCRLRRVQAPKSWLCWWIAQFILERRSRCRVKLFSWIGMKLGLGWEGMKEVSRRYIMWYGGLHTRLIKIRVAGWR